MSVDRSSDSNVPKPGGYDWARIYFIKSDPQNDENNISYQEICNRSEFDPWVSIHNFFQSFEGHIKTLILNKEMEEENIGISGDYTC